MLKNLEGARLGLFVFIGTVLIVLSIFLIGNKESLFVRTYEVKTYFSSVEGLRSGAPVWLSGYNIGSVKNVTLASDTSGRVEVTLNIEAEVKQFIRLDSEASIETAGLVGKKIISITPGHTEFDVVPAGGIISSKNPIRISEIMDESIAVIKNLEVISENFAAIVVKINEGDGTIGKLVNDEELYASTVSIINTANVSLDQMGAWFEDISAFTDTLNLGMRNIGQNVDSAITDMRGLINEIKSGEGLVGRIISDPASYDSVMAVISNLRETTEATKVGAYRLAENMEALKHNWLFKGYFEERGYWDKAEYDKLITDRIEEIKKQNEMLDQKLQELETLKEELSRNK